jgi:hypothetical protein
MKMFDDREIRYIAGEMDDAEMRAYESALDAESASLKRDLQSAFASLPKLRDDVPECQFSTAHLWNAIEASPKVKAPVFGFKRWWIAAPIAASLLVMALMYKPTGSNVPSVARSESNQPSTGITLESTPPIEPGIANSGSVATATVPEPKIPNEVQNATTSSVPVEVAPKRPDSQKPKIKKKRRTNRLQIPATGMLVADTRFDRLPGGLSVGSTSMKRAPEPASVSESDQSFGAMDSAVAAPSASGRGTLGSDPRNQKSSESIVIVSASANLESGTQTAVEVRQDDNIVIGG